MFIFFFFFFSSRRRHTRSLRDWSSDVCSSDLVEWTAADVAARREYVYGLFPRLAERRRQKAATMSGGEQAMLAMGRALMGRPKLLLLDEPSLGLAPLLVEQLFGIIRAINEGGTTVFLIEQNARKTLEIAHHGFVLQKGEIVGHGSARELAASE